MDQLELLKDMQNLLDDMRGDMLLLKPVLTDLAASVSNQRMIDHEIMQSAIHHFGRVDAQMEKCRALYQTLDVQDPIPENFTELEKMLTDRKTVLLKCAGYKAVIRNFCSLRSDDQQINQLLEKHRQILRSLSPDQVWDEDCRGQLDKYAEYLQAVQEPEAIKLTGYIQKLLPVFELPLISLLVDTQGRENLRNMINQQSAQDEKAEGNVPGAPGIPVSKIPSAGEAVSVKNSISQEKPAPAGDENGQPVSEVPAQETEKKATPGEKWLKVLADTGALVADAPEEDYSSSGRADISVKKLRSELVGKYINIRRTLLKMAYEYYGISVETAADYLNKDTEDIRKQCRYLAKEGYFCKHRIGFSHVLYTLSGQCIKIMESREMASFFHITEKKNVTALDGSSGNAAAVRSNLMEIVRREHLGKGGQRIQVELIGEQSFILDAVTDGEKKEEPLQVYIGIYTDNAEVCGTFFSRLKEVMEEPGEKRLIVAGMTDGHCEKLMSALRKIYPEYAGVTDCYQWERKPEQNESGVELQQPVITEECRDNIPAEAAGENEYDGQNDKNVPPAEIENIVLQERPSVEREAILPQQAASSRASRASAEMSRETFFHVTESYQQMICEDKIYCAMAYLRAASRIDDAHTFLPVCRKMAYAVGDPAENCSFTSDMLYQVFFDGEMQAYEYLMVSAVLRYYFLDCGYDYGMQQLQTAMKGCTVLDKNSHINKIIYGLSEFKARTEYGIDKYADYRGKDNLEWEHKLGELTRNAWSNYDSLILGHAVERAPHKRFLETKKLVFAPNGDLGLYLKAVTDDDREYMPLVKEYLLKYFIKDGAAVCSANIDEDGIENTIEKYWEKAGDKMMVTHKTSDLMGRFRANLKNQIYKVVAVLCDWVYLLEHSCIDEHDTGLLYYRQVKNGILEQIEASCRELSEKLDQMRGTDFSGCKVLISTLQELKKRLDGSYREGLERYFYIDFLRGNKVLLNCCCLPDENTEISDLPETSLMRRIEQHMQEEESDLTERLEKICEDDYGSAGLIVQYLHDMGEKTEFTEYHLEEAGEFARRAAKMDMDSFIEDLELAQSYGQIDNTEEDQKENILRMASESYAYTCKTENYGYFRKILAAFRNKIAADAHKREDLLRTELENYLSSHKELEENEQIRKRYRNIKTMLEQQNYTVAEDLINRLTKNEDDSEIELLQTDYLADFLKGYDYFYRGVVTAGKQLNTLLDTNARLMKDVRGGRRLVDNWLTNGSSGYNANRLMTLLDALGFANAKASRQEKIAGRVENYTVLLQKPENGRRVNYKHPIAAFGSKASEEGFRVVCLYGSYDSERLAATYKEIGNARHTLILLDCALSLADRRRLAQKARAEAADKVFALIDRVVLMYLANNYVDTAINRMLMAVVMPFSYYQPYVVDSVNVMPPEMFIGRKEELMKIESSSGVNIVYGGRQLGKSALLRKAQNDIDRDENGDRAVLVDVKGLDYKRTAAKISRELSDSGVFEAGYETDDWEDLARKLRKRLKDNTDRIPYLLLLVDEADAFIESSASVNFHPFDSLKEVQGVGAGRFKFVVAGLRNVVRFNRSIALGNNSVLTHLTSLTVVPFGAREARELLEVPLYYLGLRFPKEKESLVSMILASANYFPGLLQLYCAKLLEAMTKADYAGYNISDTPAYMVSEKHIKKVLAESGFREQVREKYMITLKVDGDYYYYLIALMVAYLYNDRLKQNGYGPDDVVCLGNDLGIGKIQKLSRDKIEALMEEMRELNVFRLTMEGKYLFTRHSFFEMMGTSEQIQSELANYMEDENG